MIPIYCAGERPSAKCGDLEVKVLKKLKPGFPETAHFFRVTQILEGRSEVPKVWQIKIINLNNMIGFSDNCNMILKI